MESWVESMDIKMAGLVDSMAAKCDAAEAMVVTLVPAKLAGRDSWQQ